jgi:putative PIN family toxin of toxin-antitoxin system
MAALRVVLDTNVLVSGLAYPTSIPGRIVAAWQRGSLEVVLSHYILDELVRVLPRLPKVKLTPTEIRDLTDSFMFLATLVEPEGNPELALRDPADQPILQTWMAADASYLITGDKDLLVLADKYPIVTPSQFWMHHGIGI